MSCVPPGTPIAGLPTPRFVPSVSGAAKTNLHLTGHIRALVEWRASSMLVSAYDLHHLPAAERDSVYGWLEDAMEGGTVVFMDSGGYEAKWFRDSKWSLDEYHSVIREAPHSVAFTYDLDDRPPVAVLESTGGLLGSVSGLIPIVHGFGASEIAQLADLSALPVAAVAVTERDLGDGLDEVAAAVRQVSRAVEDRAPIHVLGAGNPLSILAYAAAGASSFDGLDWCQTVADPTTGTMHHSKHLPLFAADHASGEGDYSLRLLGHNLIFFDHWMGQIRGAWSKGQLGALVSTYLPRLRPE